MLSLGAAGAWTRCLGQRHCPAPVAIPVHRAESTHPAPQIPLYVPGLHTGCYPTVPQPMVFHVSLKGSVTTPILATRQLTPSLQARTAPPIQETGTGDLPMPLLIAGVDGEASVGVGTRA